MIVATSVLLLFLCFGFYVVARLLLEIRDELRKLNSNSYEFFNNQWNNA